MSEENSQALSPISFFTQNEGQLLQSWLDNLAQATLQKDPDPQLLKEESKSLFDALVNTVKGNELPALDVSSCRPLVDLLKQLLRSRKDLGFGQRDLAVFLLSLKKSFLETLKEHYQDKPFDYNPQSQQFVNLIDVLGLITLEALNEEKQTLIQRQQEELERLRNELKHQNQFDKIIARSESMLEALHMVQQVLDSPVTVLLEGESGSGKEVFARLIHYQGTRQNKPLVVVNCGAIPDTLIESELFGHEKGSFTGAGERVIGKFELAHEGTLFLDEIGELALPMQVKLLRALQQKEIQRIGSQQTLSVNARIIAATNKNLKKEVDAGRFRLDLFYRLNVFPISIPPLRKRAEDIIPLALHVLEQACKEYGKKMLYFTDDALERLQGYPWPGNVRELQNVIHRAVLLAGSDKITSDLLNISGRPASIKLLPTTANPLLLDQSPSATQSAGVYTVKPLEELEKEAIVAALEKMQGNVSHVSKALGISRTTLYNKAKRYDIDLDET